MQNIISWLLSHEVVLGGGVVAVLDFVFAMKSSWASNGVLHFVYVQAKKFAGQDQPKQ